MAKKNKNKCDNKCCETCGHLIPCGDGDHVCGTLSECVPIVDYQPSDDYFKCGGKRWTR